jgi:Tol biopolymer transport system component
LLFFINPSSATAGGPGFTLTVSGTNFNALSVVRWNGADRTTTFVSSTQLTATIPSNDIAVGGTADVTVFNPSPGVGTSSALTFTINATPLAVIERVSVDSAGTEGDSPSGGPSLSADGRFVAFVSLATNLVAGDTNRRQDIFVRDTCVGGPAGCTPSTIRVSVDSAGTEANSVSVRPAISADGRFVAFVSLATNLVAGDTNGVHDIFVRDTCVGGPAGCTPSTIRVSVDSAGTEGNGNTTTTNGPNPSTSADGRFVAFGSGASNLVVGDTNGAQDIFVRDTCVRGPADCTPSTIRVSVNSAGIEANSVNSISFKVSMSADGRFVAFASFASNLVAGDTNAATDVFVRDTCVRGPAGCTPSTIRVSVNSAGTEGNRVSLRPAISADGRFVAFASFASNLVAGDTNAGTDFFVRDTCVGGPAGCTPSTIRVSVDSAGTEGNSSSSSPSLSADGRSVAFGSLASNLVAGDTNSVPDVFLAPTGF